MIDTYTEKYGKDKIIVPQNMSLMNTMSFTDFKDLDRDLGLIYQYVYISLLYMLYFIYMNYEIKILSN